MLTLHSITHDLQFGFLNKTSINKHFNQKFLRNFKFTGEISNNILKNLLGSNVYKTLDSCW